MQLQINRIRGINELETLEREELMFQQVRIYVGWALLCGIYLVSRLVLGFDVTVSVFVLIAGTVFAMWVAGSMSEEDPGVPSRESLQVWFCLFVVCLSSIAIAVWGVHIILTVLILLFVPVVAFVIFQLGAEYGLNMLEEVWGKLILFMTLPLLLVFDMNGHLESGMTLSLSVAVIDMLTYMLTAHKRKRST